MFYLEINFKNRYYNCFQHNRLSEIAIEFNLTLSGNEICVICVNNAYCKILLNMIVFITFLCFKLNIRNF